MKTLNTIIRSLFISLISIWAVFSFILSPLSQAGHPELRKIFDELTTPDGTTKILNLLEDRTLHSSENLLLIKEAIHRQLIQVGFTYLQAYPAEQLYLVAFDDPTTKVKKLGALQVFLAADRPFLVRINRDGSLILHMAYVGDALFQAMRSSIIDWIFSGELKILDFKTILNVEHAKPLTSLQPDRIGIHTDLDTDDIHKTIELSYIIGPNRALECRLTSEGMLIVESLHTWVPGAKSRLSHCRSQGHGIPLFHES